MNDNILFELFLILFLLVINGVFSMTEIAFVSSRRAKLKQRADEGDRPAESVLAILESPTNFLSTIQIAISLIGVFAGAIGGAELAEPLAGQLARVPFLRPYSATLALVVVVLLTTYFSLVIGELIPKRLGLNNPEATATRMVGPINTISKITRPVVRLLSASTELGLRILGVRPSTEPPVSVEEIRVLMEQGTQVGVFEEAEQDIIESVFRLGNRFVDAIMTPRTELEWIDLEDPLEENIQLVLESNHTRFPVARESLDNVLGVVSAKDILTRHMQGQPVVIEDLMQPPLFIPESMSALKVLELIREARVHVGLVIDEYGGLTGMVTLYDILKSIVGDLPDLSDEPSPTAVHREDGSWLIDGLVSIDEVKELLGVNQLPEEDRIGYQTLGGFIVSQLGSIPQAGQYFDWSGFRFEVVDMDERRVDKVLVIPQVRSEE